MRRLADLVVRWPWAVIAIWIAVAVALPLTSPSLNDMAERHPLTLLPPGAPSSVATAQMVEAFNESGSEDLLLVVLIDQEGLGRADEAVYRKLVRALQDNTDDVTMLQDFITTPPLRSVVTSEDDKAWVLPVGVAGELGTPGSYAAFQRIAAIVEQTVAGSPLTTYLTGPAATVADLTDAGFRDRVPIETAIMVLVLLVLLVVYRNVITMLLPLMTIGISLLIAQSVVARYSQLTGTGVSNQSIVFLSAVIAGAGTDYAVFLISRYHDHLRDGADSDTAVRNAMVSIGKVIAASAATVGLTFFAVSFAQMGVFQTVGASAAIGIAVAFLSAIGLLPAILVLAGPRGWVKPRRPLAARFWRWSGVRIVRRPVAHLMASALILLILAGSAGLVRYNYDDRKALRPDAPSSVGYTALEQHFPVNQSIPQYVLIQSPDDLRTSRTLADMEEMARRVSQLPGVARISGITRPTGDVPMEFKATYQAGAIGGFLADGSAMIKQRTGDLNRLVDGAGTLNARLTEVRADLRRMTGNAQRLLDSLARLNPAGTPGSAAGSADPQATDDALVEQVEAAVELIDRVNALSNDMGWNFSAVKDKFLWIGPVLAALEYNPVCDRDPSCSDTRKEFRRLMSPAGRADLDAINDLTDRLSPADDGGAEGDGLRATVERARTALTDLSNLMESVGAGQPGGVQGRINTLQDGTDRLVDGSREVSDAVTELVTEVKRMGIGLDAAASFLLMLKNDANTSAMAGLNIPTELLYLEEFSDAARIFVSPDGHSARYLVQTDVNPFSTDAMDLIERIAAEARSAQPNTTLADATVSTVGYTATLRDTRDYYQRDIRFIITATLVIVFLTLVVLLRALLAPMYLVGSVVVSYLSALGLGVLFFQFGLGQQLHWSVPPLAFVVLVAVGADYNMLLVSRLRDESPHSVRYGVIRTLSSTGGVITAAGLIFAASMFGLLFSSISTVVQGGFVIGVGILLDTFLVRTTTVPAIAALAGRANWWPSRITARPAARRAGLPAPNDTAAPEEPEVPEIPDFPDFPDVPGEEPGEP